MIAINKQPRPAASQERANELFLKLVPDITRYARFAFRRLQPEEREEALCEVLAWAFCAFRRLAERGRLDVAYAAPLARFAIVRFRSGRRFASKKASDVYAAAARRTSLSSLNATSDVWNDILVDNTQTPVPDQVCFRLDFAAWLRRLKERDCEMARFLAVGNTAREAAQRFDVSVPRVSQVRRDLRASWMAFQDEVG
jgi:hypothetical protein